MKKAENLLSSNLWLCASLFLLLGTIVVTSSDQQHPEHIVYATKRLFVFGDSYADTGNDRNPPANSWKPPFGITYPGQPSGRFSDGLIFTDFLARILGLNTPVTYQSKQVRGSAVRYGMNFAFGTTGVFYTGTSYPNMTTQIDLFQGLIHRSIFTSSHLLTSVAHVSLAGNDYLAYLSKGGSIQGFESVTPKVIDQLVVNLRRIYELGVMKISVTEMEPIGCLPKFTLPNSYQQCNSSLNQVVATHNILLRQAIDKLNNQISGTSSSPFILIDFFTAFKEVIGKQGAPQEKIFFEKPLTPCCTGSTPTSVCGSVDEKGNKLYTLCDNRSSHLFWDAVHPTQAGWEALTYYLKPTLQKLR